MKHCGDPKSFPCGEKNDKELVYLPVLHSAMVISSTFSGPIFTLPFLLQRSTFPYFLDPPALHDLMEEKGDSIISFPATVRILVST